MAVQLADGILKSRENTSSPWSEIMVKVSPEADLDGLASGFAAIYDSTHTYNTGDLCTYENNFYKCKTDGVSGTWNSTRWDFIDVDTIKSNIEGIIGDGQLNNSFTATDLTGAANELEEKVGTDPLETTAQDLSGGVNELKTSLNNKLSKSGDMLLNEQSCKFTNVTDNVTVNSEVWMPYWMRDSLGAVIGAFHTVFRADGKQGASIRARRNISGVNHDTYVEIGSNSSGVDYVRLSSPSAWRSALGIVTVSVNGTTDSSGNLATSYSRDEYLALGATGGGSITIPYVSTIADGGKICLHCMYLNGNPIPTTQMSLSLTLMPLR